MVRLISKALGLVCLYGLSLSVVGETAPTREYKECDAYGQCVTQYFVLEDGEWKKTLALPSSMNDDETLNFLYDLAEEKIVCEKALLDVPIEPKSDEALAAKKAYMQCLGAIFAKASERYYPNNPFSDDPQLYIHQFSEAVSHLYLGMNRCLQDEDCAYHETLNAYLSSAHVLEQAISTMILNIGSSHEKFNPEDWQEIWYTQPEQ